MAVAYCAIANDKDSRVLGAIIDHLGLLESGGLKPVQQQQQQCGAKKSKKVPCFMLQLDTKYYSSDVPMLSYQSIEQLYADIQTGGTTNILACLFCARREELTESFLALVSKCAGSMGCRTDVKALILQDNATGDGDESSSTPNDELLSKFAISRGIEIIALPAGNMATYSSDEESCSTGIGRIVEALETVQWPQLKRKPNPIGQPEHRNRLRKYIESEMAEEEGLENCKELTNKSANVKPNDYPDSEDEDAILEWFDKPIESDSFEPLPPNLPQIRHTTAYNSEHNQAADDDVDGQDKFAEIMGRLNEVRQSNTTRPFSERVDVSEGITYNLLKSISSVEPE